jgi:putative tryptophan/tyrosine transport system substrate-binding protein
MSVSRLADYVAAFAGMARSEALVIISAPEFFRDAALLSRLALEAGLPTVCEWASTARDGCLIGDGPNFAALWRRPAEYVARNSAWCEAGGAADRATNFIRVCC